MNVLPLRFLKKSLLVVPLLFSLSWQVVYNMERKCTWYLNYLQSSHHWIQQFYCYYYCYHFPIRTRGRLTFLRRYRTRLGKEATDVYDSMMLDSIYRLPSASKRKKCPLLCHYDFVGLFLSNYYNYVLQCPSVFCSHIYHHWLLNGLGGENSMS